ncbi:MAG: hypothetical protein OEL20_05300 [Sulfuritalea sp.]|nr:hypothetical protein [Sulfuritalea sp.]
MSEQRLTGAASPAGGGIYFASKVIHAPRWRALRAGGVPTISTWIDEAGEGQTADYAELAERSLREIARATAVVLYCEPGELLKGALLEAGAALMHGTPVLCVGECDSLSRVFRKHPFWREYPTVDTALAAALHYRHHGLSHHHPDDDAGKGGT